MSFSCKNGDKECCGCQKCFSETAEKICGLCGEAIDNDEAYSDRFYDVICERCLLSIHKI